MTVIGLYVITVGFVTEGDTEKLGGVHQLMGLGPSEAIEWDLVGSEDDVHDHGLG